MDLPPGYHDGINPDLLRAIPPAAGTVVEAGCGTGALGARFLSAHPAATYIGIEAHAGAAATARTRLSRVVAGDLEALSDAELGIAEGSVDCLVYGDVLEHLRDPWAALKRHAGWLRPGGQAVACIPNVQHWSVLVRLLTGAWRYEDRGLLDRTHLRFFSIETITELFGSAGLRLTEVHGRSEKAQECRDLQPLLRPLLDALSVKPDVYAFRSDVLQYLLRAVKP